MSKLTAGQIMPDFSFQTPFKSGLTLRKAVNGQNTALLFLRYYGCSLCQLDIQYLAEEYRQITAVGGQVLVVLQSAPETFAEKDPLKEDSLPFSIICDPDQTLYKQFAIPAAKSVEELIGGNAKAKLEKVKEKGIVHGKYEGEELQLPAVFVVDKDLKITYAHYGQNAADLPEVPELAQLLKKTN